MVSHEPGQALATRTFLFPMHANTHVHTHVHVFVDILGRNSGQDGCCNPALDSVT
jgi:hypothetical protein